MVVRTQSMKKLRKLWKFKKFSVLSQVCKQSSSGVWLSNKTLLVQTWGDYECLYELLGYLNNQKLCSNGKFWFAVSVAAIHVSVDSSAQLWLCCTQPCVIVHTENSKPVIFITVYRCTGAWKKLLVLLGVGSLCLPVTTMHLIYSCLRYSARTLLMSVQHLWA